MYNKQIRPVLDKTLGYLYFMDKSHVLADAKGRVWHHRHVASIALGRWITQEEIVHHRDHNRTNNAPENLEVLSRAEHMTLHMTTLEDKQCPTCGKIYHPSADSQKFCSHSCNNFAKRRVKRPTKEELIILIFSHTYVELGRMFGVSDNAIRKWVKAYGLKL